MWKQILVLCIVVSTIVSEEDKYAKFPIRTWVKLLKDTDFDNSTHLGINIAFNPLGYETPDKPWLILFFARWCPSCRRIIPIWENIEAKYRGKINIAAVNGEANPNVRDRFAIYKYPTTIYFSTDNKMYYYEDLYTEEDIVKFLDTEAWKKQDSYDIPTEISYVKIYYNKFTSPIMIPILIVVLFVVLVTFICVQDRKYEREKYAEARRIKQNLIETEEYRSQGMEEATDLMKEQKKPVEVYQSAIKPPKRDLYYQTDTQGDDSKEMEIEMGNL